MVETEEPHLFQDQVLHTPVAVVAAHGIMEDLEDLEDLAVADLEENKVLVETLVQTTVAAVVEAEELLIKPV